MYNVFRISEKRFPSFLSAICPIKPLSLNFTTKNSIWQAFNFFVLFLKIRQNCVKRQKIAVFITKNLLKGVKNDKICLKKFFEKNQK